MADNRISPGRRAAALVAVALVVLAGMLAGNPAAAGARLVKDTSARADGEPETVFSAIAAAWEQEDEAALANLVHEDGLRVTSGDYDRYNIYSPSQAFYYFKNQFQSHPTVSFTLERRQQNRQGEDRVHGMVVWQYRGAGSQAVQEVKLVLVLSRQTGVWRLSEINTINSR